MDILQRAEHLKDDVHSMVVVQLHAAFLRLQDDIFQVSVQFGHHQVYFIEIVSLRRARRDDVEQIDHVLMMEVLQQLDLAVNAFAVLEIDEHVLVLLDGHFAVTAFVDGFNHYAIGTESNHFGRLIVVPQLELFVVDTVRDSLLMVAAIHTATRRVCTVRTVGSVWTVRAHRSARVEQIGRIRSKQSSGHCFRRRLLYIVCICMAYVCMRSQAQIGKRV
mmetsp:Transcript_20753/g.33070  ORF Transcript_20753/g.33070 Transcript_20753/m.33070 type:complete len:219 (+) Transcript_20753:757-1413(+)